MKAIQLVTIILTAGITTNVYAAPNKPPPGPQDVNVVNTPTVTVTNPQTSVTVDNSSGNPVPVSGAVTVNNTSPIPVNVQNHISSSSVQLVGFTSGTSTGGLGLFEFAKLCQLEFPGSRMCTTQEVANSTNVPAALPAGNAWVRPVLESTGSQDDVMDITTGFYSTISQHLNCDYWKANATHGGIIVSNTGGFKTDTCGSSNHTACCAAN